MRLPKRLSDAVHFAAWCANEQQEPPAVARLIVLAHRAHTAGEHYCNTSDDTRYHRATGAFEAAALAIGYGTEWYGLWPTLRKDGRDVDLPAI